MESTESSPKPTLSIQENGKEYLRETAKWGKFLSIVGFISIGILVLFTIIFTFSMSMIPNFSAAGLPSGFGFLFGIIYIIMALIYFFPCLYLYKSSASLKAALIANDPSALEEGFKNQKSLFKFMGIFTAVILGFYAISLIFGVLGGMLSTLF